MKIIIYGANETGSIIATEFFEDHDIIVIDPDLKNLEKFSNLDLTTICADASNINILKEADIKNCDVFIACTNIDEGNIVACLMAKQLAPVIAICFVSKKECRNSLRLIREEHTKSHPLYIDHVIWPEQLLTQEILDIPKNSTINLEEFIAIAHKNNLNKNCVGFCTSAKVNFERIKKHA